MKKTVIFDFDGTLANSFPVIIERLNSISSFFGFQRITQRKFNHIRNKTILSIIKDLDISLFTLPFILNRMEAQLRAHSKQIDLFPKMEKVITQLHLEGYQIGILSRNYHHIVRKIIKRYKLTTYFRFVYETSKWRSKHHSLSKILNTYDLDPQTAIYIGDEVRDIKACKKIGIPIVAVTWGLNSKLFLQKNNPDYLVETPAKLGISIRSHFKSQR